MFKRQEITLKSNPCCNKAVDSLEHHDFQYYDKDGFELCIAEQKYYREMGHPIQYPILNHTCWQEPWFKLDDKVTDLILDHSMFLCRCNYTEAALSQLEKLKSKIPTADYLIKTRQKWGFDFALDAVRDGQVFEVLHIEYDHTDYDQFSNNMIMMDYKIRHTDWLDAADKIWATRSIWKNLTGFEQNNWKAKYLIGWDRAEYTEKSVKEYK